jgi:sulfur transfer complex TusBCD TusB component (DsrH family)
MSSVTQYPHITDEEEELLLIEGRIHWAIKRNILRDTISEDLVYAQCIKNDDFVEKLRYDCGYV